MAVRCDLCKFVFPSLYIVNQTSITTVHTMSHILSSEPSTAASLIVSAAIVHHVMHVLFSLLLSRPFDCSKRSEAEPVPPLRHCIAFSTFHFVVKDAEKWFELQAAGVNRYRGIIVSLLMHSLACLASLQPWAAFHFLDLLLALFAAKASSGGSSIAASFLPFFPFVAYFASRFSRKFSFLAPFLC